MIEWRRRKEKTEAMSTGRERERKGIVSLLRRKKNGQRHAYFYTQTKREYQHDRFDPSL